MVRQVLQTFYSLKVEVFFAVDMPAQGTTIAGIKNPHPESVLVLFTAHPIDEENTVAYYYRSMVYADLSKRFKTSRIQVEKVIHWTKKHLKLGEWVTGEADRQEWDRA